MSSSVYIIIVTYNASPWIEQCLNTVKRQISLRNVIVVDNQSSDSTIEILQQFSGVRIMPQRTNLGFGAANNLGVYKAIQLGAEFVFLLNQDTRLCEDCLSKLLDVFSYDQDIAVASPIHLNQSGAGLDLKFESYINARSCPGFISDILIGQRKPFYPINFVNAAGWMLRTDIVKQIGLFAKPFFHYGEDSNFLRRVKYFRYKAVLVPTAFMHHDRDERKGKLHKAHVARQVEIHKLNMLLDINQSVKAAYFQVFKYVGHLVIKRQFRNAITLFFSSVLDYSRIKTIRKNLKTKGFYDYFIEKEWESY